MKRVAVIAVAAFLAGAAAVTVPERMGAAQILLVVLAAAGAALAAALAVRLAVEERSRRQIEDARRQLIAAVSHDLRTPLASLRLLVESIEDGVATGETRERYLRETRTHVEVLTRLIDDLFELSRIEAGDISWTMRQVELGELIGDTVAAMRAPAEARGVAINAELPSGEVVALANAEKVQRVLFNLIQNAIRHTPADGSVTVRARSGDGRRRSRGRRRRSGDPRRARASGSLRPSTAARMPAARRAPASAWRSRGRSSRPTAAGSGWRRRCPEPGSTSRWRRRSRAVVPARAAEALP